MASDEFNHIRSKLAALKNSQPATAPSSTSGKQEETGVVFRHDEDSPTVVSEVSVVHINGDSAGARAPVASVEALQMKCVTAAEVSSAEIAELAPAGGHGPEEASSASTSETVEADPADEQPESKKPSVITGVLSDLLVVVFMKKPAAMPVSDTSEVIAALKETYPQGESPLVEVADPVEEKREVVRGQVKTPPVPVLPAVFVMEEEVEMPAAEACENVKKPSGSMGWFGKTVLALCFIGGAMFIFGNFGKIMSANKEKPVVSLSVGSGIDDRQLIAVQQPTTSALRSPLSAASHQAQITSARTRQPPTPGQSSDDKARALLLPPSSPIMVPSTQQRALQPQNPVSVVVPPAEKEVQKVQKAEPAPRKSEKPKEHEAESTRSEKRVSRPSSEKESSKSDSWTRKIEKAKKIEASIPGNVKNKMSRQKQNDNEEGWGEASKGDKSETARRRADVHETTVKTNKAPAPPPVPEIIFRGQE